MNRMFQTGSALAGFLLFCEIAAAGPAPIMYDNIKRTGGGVFELNFTARDAADTNYVSWVKAGMVVDAYTNVALRAMNELGFTEPYIIPTKGYVPSKAFDFCGEAVGTAYAHGIDLDAVYLRKTDRVHTTALCAHEFFHLLQRQYINGDPFGFWIYAQLGSFGVESTASMFEDLLFSDVDTQSYSFREKALDAVKGSPEKRLFDRSYDGCLFWLYACEQFGSVTNEPESGVDFLKEIFGRIDTLTEPQTFLHHNSLFRALDEAMAYRNTTVHDFYASYAAANMVHRHTVSPEVLARVDRAEALKYRDDIGNHWRFPRHAAITNLPAAVAEEAIALGTRYYRYQAPTNVSPCSIIGVRVVGEGPLDLVHAAVTRNGVLQHLDIARGIELTRSYFVGPDPEALNRIDLGVSSGDAHAHRYQVDYVEADAVPPIIVAPTAARPAFTDRNLFTPVTVQVRVPGPEPLQPRGVGDRSLAGLRINDFAYHLAGRDLRFKQVMYVGGDYFMDGIAERPRFWNTQPEGLYDLQVDLLCDTPLSAINTQSVYLTFRELNHVIVIDRSFSMNAPGNGLKFDAAKEAAKFYAESVTRHQGIAVVGFDGNGNECDEDAMILYADPGGRTNGNDDAVNAIDQMNLGGATSIGDGLWHALDALDVMRNGRTDLVEYITFLTDGVETEERWVDQASACGPGVLLRLTNSAAQVHAISLGRDADCALVQGIAMASHGSYAHIDIDPAMVRARAGTVPPDVLRLNLMERFLGAREDAGNLERFVLEHQVATAGSTQQVALPTGAELVTNGLFLVAWNETNATPNVELYDPSGTFIDSSSAHISTGRTFKLYRLLDTIPRGDFDLRFDPQADTDFFASFSGLAVDPLRFVFRLGQVPTGGATSGPEDALREQFEQGVPVQMQAYIVTTNGPLTGIDIDLEIALPDGSVHCGPGRMLDDGSMMDQARNDGVYGFVLTETAQAANGGVDRETSPTAPPQNSGAYSVLVRAHGLDEFGQPFTRVQRHAFQVFKRIETRDSDGDSMPDSWELFYRTDPLDPLDALEDPDQDGLVTSNEFLRGTHPFNPDTDGGGEMDGSETLFARCPFDPADDELPLLLDFQVVDDVGCVPYELLLKPNAITLRWGGHPQFQSMDIYRSSNPSNGFVWIANITPQAIDETVYCDTNLPPNSTWYYRLRPTSPVGAQGPFSDPRRGTAWLDAMPPGGKVFINPPADRTDRLLNRVHLSAAINVTHYVISPHPLTGNEPLLPFAPGPEDPPGEMTRWLELEPPQTNGLPVAVYAQFVTEAGRRSRPESALLTYDPTGDWDGDLDPNDSDPDDDNDDLSDEEELTIYRTNPFAADSDADLLTDLQEIQIGTDPLNPDSDGDNLIDGREVQEFESMPLDPDSDGNGLPDGWEVQNGFDPRVDEGEADIDHDMDGMLTGDEYLANTLPLDSNSVFRLSINHPVPELLELTFPAALSRDYDLLWKPDLTDPAWTPLDTLRADRSDMRHQLPTATFTNEVFFNLELQATEAPP